MATTVTLQMLDDYPDGAGGTYKKGLVYTTIPADIGAWFVSTGRARATSGTSERTGDGYALDSAGRDMLNQALTPTEELGVRAAAYITRRGSKSQAGDFYKKSPGVVVVDTSALQVSNYTMGGATYTASVNSGLAWYSGSSTLDVTNQGGSGASLLIIRTLSSGPTPGQAPTMLVPVYIEDFSKIANVVIRVSTGSTANEAQFSYLVGPSGPARSKRNGWHLITVGPSDWTTYQGTVDWSSAIIDIRILFTVATGSTSCRIAIDDVRVGYSAKAKVMLMTDRTYDETYSVWRPLMQSLGLRGTFAITQSDMGVAGHMTVQQINKMIDCGFDITTRNPSAMNTRTTDQCISDTLAEQNFLKNTFGDAGKKGCAYHVYANGIYYSSSGSVGDMTVPNRLASELGIKMARTTDETNAAGFLALGADGYPPNLMTMPIIGLYSGQTASSIKSLIDTCIDRQSACVYFLHDPEGIDITDANSIETQRLVFEYIASKKADGLIDDVTMDEFYSGL